MESYSNDSFASIPGAESDYHQQLNKWFDQVCRYISPEARKNVQNSFKLNGEWCLSEVFSAYPTWFYSNVDLDQSKYVSDLLLGKYHAVAIRAAQGTGKTTRLAETIASNLGTYKNAIFITSRVCVCRQIQSTLKQHGVESVMYSQCPNGHEAPVPAIVQFDSLSRFIHPGRRVTTSGAVRCHSASELAGVISLLAQDVRSYDLLVVDESESTLLHPFTKYMLPKCAASLRDLIQLMQKAKRVVFADASLGDTSVDFLLHFCGKPMSQINIKWMTRRPDPKSMDFLRQCHFGPSIVRDLRNDLKVIVGCDTRRMANNIASLVSKRMPGKRVILHTHNSGDDVNSKIQLCNTAWLEYDCVVHSPTITFGLDFNQLHFDRQYYHFCGIIPALTAFQMIGRARITRTMNVVLCLRLNKGLQEQETAKPCVDVAAHIGAAYSRTHRVFEAAAAAAETHNVSVALAKDLMTIPDYVECAEQVDDAVEVHRALKHHPIMRLYARHLISGLSFHKRFVSELKSLCTCAGYILGYSQLESADADFNEEDLEEFRLMVVSDFKSSQHEEDLDSIMSADRISANEYASINTKVMTENADADEKLRAKRFKLEMQLGIDQSCTVDDALLTAIRKVTGGQSDFNIDNIVNFGRLLNMDHAPFYAYSQSSIAAEPIVESCSFQSVEMFQHLFRSAGARNIFDEVVVQDVTPTTPVSDSINLVMRPFIRGDCPGIPSYYVMTGIKTTDRWIDVERLTFRDFGTVVKKMSKLLLGKPMSVRFVTSGKKGRKSMRVGLGDETASLFMESLYVSKVKDVAVLPDDVKQLDVLPIMLSMGNKLKFKLSDYTGVFIPAAAGTLAFFN